MLRQEMLEMKAMLEIVQRQTLQPLNQSFETEAVAVSPRTVSEVSDHPMQQLSAATASPPTWPQDPPANISGLPEVQTIIHDLPEAKTIITGDARPGITIPSSLVSSMPFPRSETHQVSPPPTLAPPAPTLPPSSGSAIRANAANTVELPVGQATSMVPRARDRSPPYIPSGSVAVQQQSLSRDVLNSSMKPAKVIGGGVSNATPGSTTRSPTTLSPTRIVPSSAVMPQPARTQISPRHPDPQLPSNIVVHHGERTTTVRQAQRADLPASTVPSRSSELLHQLPPRHARR